MPHLPPQESVQLQDRPGLTLLQRDSGFSEDNSAPRLCREPDRSTRRGISFRATSWSIPCARVGDEPHAAREEKAGRDDGGDVGSHTSFRSSHRAARPVAHPKTQNPRVEGTRGELLLRSAASDETGACSRALRSALPRQLLQLKAAFWGNKQHPAGCGTAPSSRVSASGAF